MGCHKGLMRSSINYQFEGDSQTGPGLLKYANGPGDGVRTRNLPINSRVLCRIELRRDGPIRRKP